MVNLFLYANYYYNFGFNITHIIPKINEDQGKRNPFKSSVNDRAELGKFRQRYSDVLSFNWIDAVGIGTELGFNNLRALDFDGCHDTDFVRSVLEYLGLPRNYEWLIRTGSNNGFHILFYTDEHRYLRDNSKTKAFVPNIENQDNFSVLELRWHKHLILPPSLSKTFKLYRFENCELPLHKPWDIKLSRVESLVEWLVKEQNGDSNIEINGAHAYYEHEFLDFSPIRLYTESELNIKNKYDFENFSSNLFETAVKNIIRGNFNHAYKNLIQGFENCTCDCKLSVLFDDNFKEILVSFETNHINCKAYELDFIRAVFYFFTDSEKFDTPQASTYQNSLTLIESYIKYYPEEEIGYYIKGRVLSGLDKFNDSINQLEIAALKKETSRVLYRIGRIKEAFLNETGINYLYKSILIYPSSLCCNKWLMAIAQRRNIKLSSDSNILSNYFNNKSFDEYVEILNLFKKNDKVILENGKAQRTAEAFELFTNTLIKDALIFTNKIEQNILGFNKDETTDIFIKSICSTLKDYRSDEGDSEVQINEQNIRTWINQFDEEDRIIILQEMDHIFKKRYCSKEMMKEFLESLVVQLASKNGYENITEFLLDTTFLDLQPSGKSQSIILELLNEIIQYRYNISICDCGTRNQYFAVYVDDILCTGLTLVTDIIDWSKSKNASGIENKTLVENGALKLYFAYGFYHKKNYEKKIFEMSRKISEAFIKNCNLYHLIEVDNSLNEGSPVDLIYPSIENSTNLFGSEIFNEKYNKIDKYRNSINASVDKHTSKYNSISRDEFYRPSSLPNSEEFFTNKRNREVVEKAFLVKGIEILDKVKSSNRNMRALGYTIPSQKNFGFGALCFTWRNIPNNTPLIFWYSIGGFTPLFKVTRGIKTPPNSNPPLQNLDFDTDLPF